VQAQRSPEEMETARLRAEHSRRLEATYRACNSAKGHSMRCRSIALEGLRQMSSAAAAPEEFQACAARYQSAQQASRRRQDEGMLAQLMCPAVGGGAAAGSSVTSPAVLLRSAAEEEDEAMVEAANLMGAEDVGAMTAVGMEGLAPAGERRGASEVQALLEQLRTEPSGEAECAAKFLLYEGYGREVEGQRETLLKFHGESRETLPAAVVHDMDRRVGAIDSREAMGIPDDAREWFVYHMMRQAERNNFNLAKMLSDFEQKLAFLAKNDQPECPVCLERFSDAGPRVAETLGCCHKVCHECWDHWTAITSGRPFCPLCRRDEFLVTVSAAAA